MTNFRSAVIRTCVAPGCLRPPVIVKIDSSLVVFIPTVKLPQAQIAGAEVIVNNIENNGHVVFVGRADEFLEGRWSPVLAFNGKNQSRIVSPRKPPSKLHRRHHFNGVDPEISKVGKLFDGFIKISRQDFRWVIKSADVQFIDDQFMQRGYFKTNGFPLEIRVVDDAVSV